MPWAVLFQKCKVCINDHAWEHRKCNHAHMEQIKEVHLRLLERAPKYFYFVFNFNSRHYLILLLNLIVDIFGQLISSFNAKHRCCKYLNECISYVKRNVIIEVSVVEGSLEIV